MRTEAQQQIERLEADILHLDDVIDRHASSMYDDEELDAQVAVARLKAFIFTVARKHVISTVTSELYAVRLDRLLDDLSEIWVDRGFDVFK